MTRRKGERHGRTGGLLSKVTAGRFLRSVRIFISSEVGGAAKLLTASLVILFFAINALNVLNSFVGRNFMTANRRQAC